MPGKHASSDNSQFVRDVLSFGLRWLLGAIIIFGGAWFLTTQVFGGTDRASSTTTTAIEASPTSVPASTEPTPDPTVAASITTVVVTPAPVESTTATTVAPSSTTTTVAPTTTRAPELTPDQITVRVLNSTGRNGLAATVTSDLAALGYIMRTQDNYGTPLATTTVFFIPGLGREALTLASQLPGETITEVNPATEPSADLLVVLGSSYP